MWREGFEVVVKDGKGDIGVGTPAGVGLMRENTALGALSVGFSADIHLISH